MKNNTKNTKRTHIYVNMLYADGILEIKYELIMAKLRAKLSITVEEGECLEQYGAGEVLDVMDAMIQSIMQNTTTIKNDDLVNKLVNIIDEDIHPKKLPWYKRFWNWITRKK